MQQRQSRDKAKPSQNLANQLKARLFDKGFSYGTLPSVKRQTKNQDKNDKKTLVVALCKNSLVHPMIIKEQSTVFQRNTHKESSKSKFQKIQQPQKQIQLHRNQPNVFTISRVPSANKISRPISRQISRQNSRIDLRHSKSTYRLMTSTTQNFNRQKSTQDLNKNRIPSSYQRAQTANFNENEMKKTKIMMNKISGKQLIDKNNLLRPQTSKKKTQSEKMIKLIKNAQEQYVATRPIKQLDRYIELILKNVAHVDEFVYLKRSKNYQQDPYDLEVVDYGTLKKQQKSGLKQYYTISRKGICLYYQNNPKQFQNLNNWLQQRGSFDRIKSLNFFKQFRKWKTLKMWHKKIMKQKIQLYAKNLQDKLFYLNNNLRNVLLLTKQKVFKLQQLRILNYTSSSYESDSTYNLQTFAKIQRKNRAKIKQTIKKCSTQCRQFVRQGFKKCINQLKAQAKPVFNSFKTIQQQQKKKLPKTYTPSSKQAAYQKLQFPDSMDYQMRSKLRNECTKFIRFSFLIDFITLDSLRTIYLSSVLQFKSFLQRKLTNNNVHLVREKVRDSKSIVDPIFQVSIEYNFIESKPIKKVSIQPFMLAPAGTHTISDYKILAHVNLKKIKQNKSLKNNEQIQSQYEQVTKFFMQIPGQLCPQWISFHPSSQNHFIEISNSLDQGLQTLQCFQRWSKHQQMNIYIDVLQEWDDKISQEQLNEDFNLHPDDWIDVSSNEKYKNQMKAIIEQSFQETSNYIYSIFEKYLIIYWENQKIDYSLFTNQHLSDPSDSIQYSLEHFVYQKELFAQIPLSIDKQLLRINTTEIKQFLQTIPTQCLIKLYHMLPPYIKNLSTIIQNYLTQSIKSLRKSTTNVADFVSQMKSLKIIDKKLPKLKDKISFIGQVISVLQNLKHHINGLDKDAVKIWKSIQTHLLQQMSSLQNAMSKAQQGAEKNMIRFAQQVSKNLIPTLNKEIIKIQNLVQEKKFLTFNIQMDKAIIQLEEYDLAIKRFEEDAKKYAQYQTVLNMSETRFSNLQDLRLNLNTRLDMWKSLRDWQKLSSQWINSIFEQINVDDIKQHCDKYTRIVSKCTKRLPVNPVLDSLRSLLTTFKDALPVVIALSNKKLQQDPQYWGQIQKIVKKQFYIDNNFKMKDLIQKELHCYQNQIIQISTLVKQEEILKQQIQQNKFRWTKLQFTVKQYKLDDPKNKETYVLDQIEELYSELDQILANFSSILSNRYLKRQRIMAQQLQKSIFNATLIVDDWLIVQKNWIYLQNIFASSDIKSKLRQQNAKFQIVDKNFKNHMRLTFRSKFVHKCLGNHETWIRYKDTLAQIQKQLEKYLQDKRNDFPRFYFLSNDQLIQILAKANDTQAIQKNIRKCFQCISKIVFQQNSRYIESLLSPQGQILKISKTNINAKGQIQNWLKMLEGSIDQTLKKAVAKGYLDYEQSKDRITFIKSHLSQITLLVCQINWTLDTEAFLQNLDDFYKLLLRQLSDLTLLIRDPNLSDQNRKTLIALITQDVHNRDIIQELMEIDNIQKNDFIWAKQLRFYIEGEGFQAIAKAKQIDAQLQYGYQYLGIMSRLVITPLTDRCWMTIIGAINIKLGAAPAGPAGTGKTESTKDLAKGLGMLCIVFNCSQQIQFRIMGRLFAGLSQQGAWSCLDQFNRIDIQVLSVIAQQLLTIRVAKLRGDSTFFFNERMINLKSGCGVFITMNPGYAGRTQLPDNLKVLFRSVSMMIPDYRLIAQIMLFAQGFQDAKILSKKMVQLYKLSSEQLSQQDHYDFGMRAVKSVLVMAGALKRKFKNGNQEQLLIQAMRNSNIPKFLKEDLPLFQALISDLFPHSQMIQVKHNQLEQEMKNTCKQLNLQVVLNQISKSIQLFQTFKVRFGVMIVGSTNSGKTSITDLLALSLTSLYKKNTTQNFQFKKIKRHTLNPKAISMGQLYGQINQLTQQWHDGLASSIMRQCANEQQQQTMNWVVFDGPVDALWIQNMNTVLDDNMMLCLANGQRIKLINSMKMLFEVMDLKVASPATVSRCGMVYMISQQLNWRSCILSWADVWCQTMYELDENDEVWINQLKSYLMFMFEKSIQPIHRFINKKAKQPIYNSQIQLCKSLQNILEILFQPINGFKIGQQREYKKKYLTYAFTYSFIWSTCITTIDKYHQDLSYQCRALIQAVIYPNNDNVQNFYFDSNQVCFRSWNEKLPQFSFQKQSPFHSIIVETIDTVRYSFIIELLKRNIKPILITGPSGTGKSIHLLKLDHSPLILTSTTSHYQLQLSVESRLDKIRKNILGSSNGSVSIVSIDDTNMPAQQIFGAIPAVQVLRTIVDKKGIWDRKQRFWKHIQNTTFVCACSPPGGGRNQLTPRFTRHFNILCLPEPSHQSLTRIFKQILEGFFIVNQFSEVVKKSSQSVVNATIQIYTILKKQKLPIPSKFHYTFNLRDISKVFQGILLAKKTSCRDVQSLGKLWFHESSRVLKDRLNCEQDHLWTYQKMHDILQVNFRVRKRDSNIYFSNILKIDTHQYEQLADLGKITAILQEYQDDYNNSSDTKLQLVFFHEAKEHILRIQRILTMSRGNGLLLGVSGSGKQSITKLSCFITGQKLRQIQIIKGYNIDSFRNFLKGLMRQCSDKDQATTFLFTDNQIMSELFLEDINNILNLGEIPNVWQIQEKEDIINTTRPFNALLKRPQSPQIIYRTFIQRVRDRLHVILSMSPIGNSLRVRCRKFPALVNCCTINWFFPWPEDALITVATALLQNYDKIPVYDNLTKRNDVIQALADICKQVHISANNQAIKFEESLKRKVYTTPKSYIDMLKLYMMLLDKKQKEVLQKRDRLVGGLQKLEQANIQVNQLQKNLIKLKPELQKQSALLKKSLIQVQKDSKQAAQIQMIVSIEAQEVSKQKNQIQILTDEAKQRLKQVQPDLQKARKAVQTIDRKALQSIRSYPKPPPAVQIVMEGVCILFGIKGDWQVQKKLLIKLDDFITSLKQYKKDNIPEDRLMKLRIHLQKNQFKEEILVKKVRQMLQIAQWCKAIQKYAVVSKQIQPKKKKMIQLQKKLDEANKQLQNKMIVLKAAQIKVQKLKNDTNQMMAKKNQLQKQLQLTRDRLERATDLTRLTKDEAGRWKQTVQNMKYDIVNMPLDVFVSAAAISYNGPFTGAYRKNLIDYWTTIINAKQIPISSDFQISRVLGDPLTIRDWIILGLPSDNVSIQNAIFSKEGNRWPLLIDPQNQALKWLCKMFQSKMKKSLNLNNVFFLSQMKSSIKNGLPVIVSDVQETLPAVLDTVFAKQIKIQQNMPMIKFGDQNIYYDSKFEMFMITKLANPNFLPQIFIRVNIINFTVTFNGLKDQLLAVVVKHQRQEIQKQRDDNIVLMGQCNKTINQSELNILRLLKKAKSEAILDDIQLIDTLKESQQASKYIKIKMEQSKKLQESINLIRQQYSSVSTRGAILFFVIKDLSIIDTMYQYSLQYVQKIVNMSMQSADKSQKLEERLINLINQITFNLYKNVSRSLFQKDKTIFSFIIASSINRQARIIAEDIWSVFSRGPQIIDQSYFKTNPSKILFTNKAWQLANYLQHSFAKFIGLTSSLTNKIKQWEAFINEGNIFELYPDDWDNKLDLFDKILIWRIIQPQKIASALTYYISQTIGEKYLVSPNISLKDLWKDSDSRTPIIFVLSPGADPTNSLFKLTKQLNMDIQVISLGQGQGQPAAKLISKAKISGKWVLLQNCHLAKTWMPQMQKIIEENSNINTEIHENFRLYLTSMPAQYFPMSVLQNGIKLTTQPPRGIKANLKRSWNQIDEQNLRACPNKTESFHKLLWGLTFFHAIIQQRQKFGPLGWNIKYEFNESDLQTSKTVLQMLLNKSQVIPFQALLFVTGQINYGGRVTDDWDRRCLKTILSQFYTQQILSNKYQFSQSKQHIIPTFQSIQNYRSYIETLPLQEQTSVFGMHPNANITFYQQQQKQIMDTLLNLQPRDSITSGKSSQDIILELVTSILDKKQVPQLFVIQHAHKDIFLTNQKGLLSSLSTFLLQEIVRFNQLLKVIKTSLQDLKKAINGIILMSDQLDTMFYSLLLNKVPSNWSKVSYPSLKSMNSWLKDLKLRTGFINQWLNDGNVNSYWLSSFFFPQGFLTGVLQQYARQPDKQIAIDQLVFSFKFTDLSKQKCQNKPTQGIYIHGLFLQGGAWDYSKKILIEPIKNQISCIMPLINFIPLKIQQKKVNQKYEVYQCPVYKTSTRAGVLSTTGQSTNFVLSVQLPSIQQSQAWILQGTALLLQLNQ